MLKATNIDEKIKIGLNKWRDTVLIDFQINIVKCQFSQNSYIDLQQILSKFQKDLILYMGKIILKFIRKKKT